MSKTYTQLLVQIVFAVKKRENLITENHRVDLEKYICGLVKHRKCKPLAIYCNPDHCHLLVALNPEISISELTGEIKALSSKWMNQHFSLPSKFSWQSGFGAFSYSRSQLSAVARYIENQPNHHKKHSFREEYLQFLNEFDIDFETKYLFEFFE